MKSVTENLFENYQRSRKSQLSLDQFKRILRLFPSLIVCMSDGKFDRAERIGMMQNIKAGLLYKPGQLSDKILMILMQEVDYLAKSLDCWKQSFLAALKFELIKTPDDKEFVLESMYLFANIHRGICQREQLQIDKLVSELSLSS
jgi:hypothetical protein